ncbi:MAG: hypothetical protein APF77_23155 [Clostridia bacterium BRH_c25]|nr:MAG: hypothetical protein APF77_23155 [Clostridia bacterium BRH_c25]
MNLVRKIFSKLNSRSKRAKHKPEKKKDNDDPANVLYEVFEHGYKYPKEEIGCGINLMKHRNEL